MAWTTPRTWVTSEVVTASLLNTHVRDNFNETGPGIATAANRFILTDGANSIVERATGNSTVATQETTASASYTDLATSGPAVTVSTGIAALVILSCGMYNSGANNQNFMSYAVSGATTISATDGKALQFVTQTASEGIQASFGLAEVSLNAGSNTFTAKYRVDAGTGTFRRRFLTVVPLS